MNRQLRQGDVFLDPIKSIDLKGAIRINPENDRLILARGEATGHHHSIDAACAELFQVQEKMVLIVAEPTTIDHQEHGAIEIAPGQYWVVAQREYHPDAIRRVVD